MHELAVIVGEDATVRDLVPVFDQFLCDLDEVRIGVLKHLADFIKVFFMLCSSVLVASLTVIAHFYILAIC